MTDTARFIGVDGARISKRIGWIAIAIDDDGFVHARFLESFRSVLDAYPEPCVIAVDIPIGLSTNGSRGADLAARAVLGPRASSVFPSPVRSAVEASEYSEACALSEAACGKKIGRQTWAIVPRIREVDLHSDEPRVFEVHPEVSFRFLGEAPAAFSKKTWGGFDERRLLLERAGIVIPEDLGEASGVVADDVLDAAVAAWSARRIARKTAVSLPAERTEFDGSRAIAIWA